MTHIIERDPEKIFTVLHLGDTVSIDRNYFNNFCYYLEEKDYPIKLNVEICGQRVTLNL